jgi:hypothetical protein
MHTLHEQRILGPKSSGPRAVAQEQWPKAVPLPRTVPLRLTDLTPHPKNYLYVVGLVMKISFPSFKSYSTFYSG